MTVTKTLYFVLLDPQPKLISEYDVLCELLLHLAQTSSIRQIYLLIHQSLDIPLAQHECGRKCRSSHSVVWKMFALGRSLTHILTEFV